MKDNGYGKYMHNNRIQGTDPSCFHQLQDGAKAGKFAKSNKK